MEGNVEQHLQLIQKEVKCLVNSQQKISKFVLDNVTNSTTNCISNVEMIIDLAHGMLEVGNELKHLASTVLEWISIIPGSEFLIEKHRKKIL